MTAELVLLLAVYAALIIGLFFGDKGVTNAFHDNLPKLSIRVEKHVAVGGEGDFKSEWKWVAPP